MDLVTKQFYKICELLDDDYYRVASVIISLSPKSLNINYVVAKLEKNDLEPFSDTLDAICALDDKDIIETSKKLNFEDERKYIAYLQGLLNLNNIHYAHCIITKQQGGARMKRGKISLISYQPTALKGSRNPKSLF